jgi:hypothetical protein
MSDDVDPIDPENLPLNPEYTPALVQVRGQGPVYVADYQTLDSGWLRVTEWRGCRVIRFPARRRQRRH